MLWLKALHIVFVVTWFAGLFYIVRLFIYHTEAKTKPEPDAGILQRQYSIMERRLWLGITWPSMVLVWLSGVGYAWFLFGLSWPAWLILKFAFVVGLTLYHLRCQQMFSRFRNGTANYSSTRLRLWNEVTTLFLLAIVFIVVLRDTADWRWGLAGILILAAILFIAVLLYKKKRQQHEMSGEK